MPTAADVARSLLEGGAPTLVRPVSAVEPEPGGVDLTDCGLVEATPPPGPSRAPEPTPLSSSSASLLGLGSGSDPRHPGSPRPTYWRGIARIGAQVADALAYAHSQGVLHRDIKPSNLLLDARGVVWVADFGLAKIDDRMDLTHTGDILGTLRYMPPEAFEGRHDARGDVYSLGLSLYEMLAYRPAFDESERGRLIHQVTSEEPPRLRTLNPEVPRDLETVVHKAIERDPSHRYATAADLAEDLRRYVEDRPILARRASETEKFRRWCRRNPAPAGLLATLFIVFWAGFGLVTSKWREAVAEREEKDTQRLKAVASERDARLARDRAEDATKRALLSADRAEASRNAALAETARALLSETRALRLSREMGWRDEAMRNLARLATLDTPARDPVRLRTEAVACLGEPDARSLVQIGSGLFGAWDVEFHPDGKTLAINDEYLAQVHLWDIEAGRAIRDIPKANGRAPFAFHPDGSCLAVGASGNRVVYEPLADGAKVPPPLLGPSMALALAFDRAGGRIAVAWGSTSAGAHEAPYAIERVVVYEVARGSALRTILGPFDTVNYKVPLALMPDGSAVATMGPYHEVQIWKVVGDEKSSGLGFHLSQVLEMAFAPDGATLATCGRTPDPVVKVWDVVAGRERLALHGHSANVWGVAFSPDGATLASAGNDLTVRLWDPRDGRQRLVATTGTGNICLSVAFAPDGRRVAVGGNIARVIELEGFDARRTLTGHDNVAYALAFRPGRSELASGSIDLSVIFWDLKAGSRRSSSPTHPEPPHTLAYTPDGTWLVIGPSSGGPLGKRDASIFDLRVVDADARGRQIRLKGARSTTKSLAIDPSGRRIAAGFEDGSVIVWDVATRAILGRLALSGSVESVAFLPAVGDAASTLFAAAAGGQTAQVDLVEWEPRLATIPGNPGHFAVSRDGARLAVGSPDGSIRLLRLPDLVPLARETAAHAGSVGTMAFHPDGRHLATACSDRRVVVRDAWTLRPLFEIAAPMAYVNILAFSPDGATLAFTGTSEDVTVWDFDQIRAELDALGLGLDSPGSTRVPSPSPSKAGLVAARTPMIGIVPWTGREVLDVELGPGASSATYRRALDELRRDAQVFSGGTELVPREATLNRNIACLYLLVGDRPGFDRHCEALISRLTADGPPHPAGEVAWFCSFAPEGGVDPDRLIGLARLAISNNPPGEPWWRNVLACALLRAGRYGEALDSLDDADRLGPTWHARQLNDLVRAIIRFRQGRPAEARPLLDSALNRAGRPRGGQPEPGRILRGAPLHDALTFEVLRREAELLLLDATFPADSFAR
jgi:WD40 repeat protein